MIENGLFQLTLSTPAGDVSGIHYNDVDNVLETSNEEFDRGYVYILKFGHTCLFSSLFTLLELLMLGTGTQYGTGLIMIPSPLTGPWVIQCV